MKGRSGATFTVFKCGKEDAVVSRLRAQHEWLSKPRPRTVKVGEWCGDGYEMELLENGTESVPRRLEMIGEILRAEVWVDAQAPIDWPAHLEIITMRGAPTWLTALGERLGPPTEACVAHGDPTAENLMIRPDSGQWVLVDPVPDASCGTGERAADMGKMLQSAVGYEALRSGDAAELHAGPGVEVVRRLARDATEWARARYWLGVWLTMIRAYQAPEVAAQITTDLGRLRPLIEGVPAVFLDRDGTINYTGRDGRPPRNGEGLQIIPGAVEAAKLLRERGFTLVIVTNQPEISRGTLPLGHVNRSNTQAQQAVGAVAVMTCSHDWRVQDCECRKPKPGMLLKAALAHNIDLTRSWIIGDKDTDVEAGLAAGAKGILLQANVPNELPRSLQPILWEEQHANLP